jgi:putative FmdB family regulatory protein
MRPIAREMDKVAKIKKWRVFPEEHPLPLYEYHCTACGYKFEKIQSFSAKPETECPKCQGVLIRPVTAPALRFEGAGWYVNDYAGKGGPKTGDTGDAPAAAGASSSDSKDAKPEAKSNSGSTSDKATSSGTPAPAPAATPAAAPSSTPTSS